MPMKINRERTNKKLAASIIIIVLVLCAAAGYSFYAKSNGMWPFKNTVKDGTVGTDVEDHSKSGGGSGQDNSTASGGVSDTGGKDVESQSGGVSSQSGNITLFTPQSNQNISGSIMVTGVAKVPEVFYRISDDVNGMINSGKLSVNDGQFSGKLFVNTSAKQGTFEVYNFNAQGQEVNNINIAVSY